MVISSLSSVRSDGAAESGNAFHSALKDIKLMLDKKGCREHVEKLEAKVARLVSP